MALQWSVAIFPVRSMKACLGPTSSLGWRRSSSATCWRLTEPGASRSEPSGSPRSSTGSWFCCAAATTGNCAPSTVTPTPSRTTTRARPEGPPGRHSSAADRSRARRLILGWLLRGRRVHLWSFREHRQLRHGVGVDGAAARRALIHVDQLVLADQHHVAVVEVVPAHARGLHVDAVGAVQVLDHARMSGGDDLAVVATDEAAVDVHVIVRSATDDHATDAQRNLLHGTPL